MIDNKKNENYEQWVDIFKGILIIFVVVGHGYYQKLNDIIFWFHMPLFFLISGYLFKMPDRRNIKIWCIKQIKSLLIPCVFFYVVNMLLVLNHASVSDIIKKIIFFVYGGRMLPGVYWFITCLLLSRIIMALIEICVDNKNVKIAIYVGMYVLAVIESKVIIPDGIYYYPNVPLYCLIPWNADVCLFSVPFMAVGRLLREEILKTKEKIENHMRIREIVLICIAFGVFIMFSVLQMCNIYSVEINMKYVHYSNLVLCAVLPLSAGYVLKKCSMLLSNVRGIATALCEIGKSSLTIMYTHLLIRDYIMIPIFGEKYSVILWIIISCIIGILIRVIAKKNKITSMIILGK